jgi:hypothetical protein
MNLLQYELTAFNRRRAGYGAQQRDTSVFNIIGNRPYSQAII